MTVSAVQHYTDMALQAQKGVYVEELGRALNHLSLALLYPKVSQEDLERAKVHIANAEKALREIEG